MQEALEGLHRADVGKQPQFFAHSQQALFRTHLCGGIIVELRVTYGEKSTASAFLQA